MKIFYCFHEHSWQKEARLTLCHIMFDSHSRESTVAFSGISSTTVIGVQLRDRIFNSLRLKKQYSKSLNAENHKDTWSLHSHYSRKRFMLKRRRPFRYIHRVGYSNVNLQPSWCHKRIRHFSSLEETGYYSVFRTVSHYGPCKRAPRRTGSSQWSREEYSLRIRWDSKTSLLILMSAGLSLTEGLT